EPTTVSPEDTSLRLQHPPRCQLQHSLKENREFFLPTTRHEEVPERPEALAFIGFGNRIAFTHDFLQQSGLRALPQRNAFPHCPIQLSKVALHFAKIRQQIARQLNKLQEAVPKAGVVQDADVSCQNSLNFGIDFRAALLQFCEACLWIGFAALGHLFEQLKHSEQTRFGTNETALAECREPNNRLLGRRG